MSLVKKVNALLNKRVVDMERKCWENAQYSRRKCLEVVGIPRDVFNEDLECKVLQVFTKVGFEIPSRNIEACHHLTNRNDRIIVKFYRRKDWDWVIPVKMGPSKSQTGKSWVTRK